MEKRVQTITALVLFPLIVAVSVGCEETTDTSVAEEEEPTNIELNTVAKIEALVDSELSPGSSKAKIACDPGGKVND